MAPSAIFTSVRHRGEDVTASEVAKVSIDPHEDLAIALRTAKARFIERHPTSLKLHEEAINSLPGGNTRTLLHTTPFPISIKSGSGYEVTDEDGHTYTDILAEMTAALYGHSNSVIKDTLVSTAQTVGLNVGATTKLEARYALLLCTRFSLDRIRFCNSGTEANMHALAAARKLTGKRKVVVFANGYHGAVLAFPGGKPAENNVDLDDWIIARYNDIDSATTAIRTEGVCAVILEGMQGSGGAIPGTRDFLHAVQKVAKEAGVLFILDEVMTSRLSPGGLAEIFDLTPDIKTFGKYLGGGLAFGAFGGKQEAMKVFDPREPGALVHSGTFNNNTLVMACGHAGLSQIFTPEACKEFNKLGDWMLAQLNEICRGTKLSFTGRGTIQCAHFTANGTTKILRAEDVDEDSELRDLFWMEMLEAGFWTSKGAKFALILGTPKTEIERFLEAVKDFLDKYRQLIKL